MTIKTTRTVALLAATMMAVPAAGWAQSKDNVIGKDVAPVQTPSAVEESAPAGAPTAEPAMASENPLGKEPAPTSDETDTAATAGAPLTTGSTEGSNLGKDVPITETPPPLVKDEETDSAAQ